MKKSMIVGRLHEVEIREAQLCRRVNELEKRHDEPPELRKALARLPDTETAVADLQARVVALEDMEGTALTEGVAVLMRNLCDANTRARRAEVALFDLHHSITQKVDRLERHADRDGGLPSHLLPYLDQLRRAAADARNAAAG